METGKLEVILWGKINVANIGDEISEIFSYKTQDDFRHSFKKNKKHWMLYTVKYGKFRQKHIASNMFITHNIFT